MKPKRIAYIAALALFAGACGGGDDGDTNTRASRRTTTTEESTTTTESGSDLETTGTTAERRGSSATTTRSGGSATTNRSGGSSAGADFTSVPAPAASGTYDYAQSGAVGGQPVPPNGTLVVNGPGPDQVFQRYFDPAQPPSDLFFSFRPDGPFITKVIVRQQGAAVSCTFDAPVPAPPWPPTSGRTFSGQATCDNGFKADFSGTVGGRTTDTVGDKRVEAVVINSTLHITGEVLGTPIDVTVADTQHWAPSLRVSTFSRETISGNISGDVTSTLKSVNPR